MIGENQKFGFCCGLLSKGGEDSEHNTVALCPNCHRKMHILNNKSDRDILTNVPAKNN